MFCGWILNLTFMCRKFNIILHFIISVGQSVTKMSNRGKRNTPPPTVCWFFNLGPFANRCIVQSEKTTQTDTNVYFFYINFILTS